MAHFVGAVEIVCTSLVLASAVLAASGAAPAQPTIKPVASVRQLHDLMITPASDALFDTGRQAPASDSEWTAIRNQAVLLAESGNLLMLGSRARDRRGWMKRARALVDAAVDAVNAADAKDAAALDDANGRIVVACEDCHAPYRDKGRRMLR